MAFHEAWVVNPPTGPSTTVPPCAEGRSFSVAAIATLQLALLHAQSMHPLHCTGVRAMDDRATFVCCFGTQQAVSVYLFFVLCDPPLGPWTWNSDI